MVDSVGFLDKRCLRAAFQQAAPSYDSAAALQREIGDRLIGRLDVIRLQPRSIIDLGSGTGYCTRALARRYPGARIIGVDIAPAMARNAARRTGRLSWPVSRARVRYVCGDAESLPVLSGSVDMVLSNLALQWCSPDAVFAEIARVLRPGGVLMFTSFGPGTLRELRLAWSSVDNAPHVHDFIDMHDLGDALLRARLVEPVVDVDRLVLTYPGVLEVLRALKAIGAHNVARDRHPGLTGKGRFAAFRHAYGAMAGPDGQVPVSYEVVYGHAWAPLSTDDNRWRTHGTGTVPLNAISRIRR